MALTFVEFSNADPATDLVDALASPGTSFDNLRDVTFVGADGQTSFFTGGGPEIGIESGVLFTSGSATPPTTNTLTGFGQFNGLAGDPDLDVVVNSVFATSSFDANSLTFTFDNNDPSLTSINIPIVFGSDEFPEFVDSFVDVAAVLVNGVNTAFFNENPMQPLSVLSQNLSEFQDNQAGSIGIEYDGVSNVLQIVAPLKQGENTIKFAIADTGDFILDSGLFVGGTLKTTVDGGGGIGGGGTIVNPPESVDIDTSVMGPDSSVVIDVKESASDTDGEVVDANIIDDPTNGEAVDNDDGTITYSPDIGFSGTDTFTYVAVDNEGGVSAPSTVNLVVSSDVTNPPPIAVDDSYSTPQDTAIFVPAPGVFSNDSDPDGTIVTANLVTATSDPVALMFVDDGSFSFTPAPGFTGTETFQYEAVDDDGAVSNVATVTIDVVGEPENLPPVAVDDIILSQGTSTVFSVIDNDVDPDGTVVDATVVDGPTNGFLVDEPGGSFIYGPDVALDPTSDSFTYVAIDDDGAESNVATVFITFEGTCTVIDATPPSETFDFTGGQLQINDFDTDDIATDENTSDTLTFEFDGATYNLNDVQEILDFVALIENDGIGTTDAAYDEDGDLAFILSRNPDGSVADGIVLTDVIDPADVPGSDGLTVEALAAAGADMFNMFADESDAFCAFGPADPLIA